MRQMAGVMVSDPFRAGAKCGRSETVRDQEFGQITDTPAEGGRFRFERWIPVQEMPVLLERRATASSVDHNEIEPVSTECFDIPGRIFPRLVEASAMGEKRAATNLVSRRDDVEPRDVQQSNTRGVRVTEHHAHRATSDEAHSAFGGLDCGL